MTLKSYLGYRIERSMPRTLALTLFAVIISQVVIRGEIRDSAEVSHTGLYILAVILGAACALVPMFELSALSRRRSLDLLFSFPVSRFRLALAHALSGWVQILIIYTVPFFLAWTVYIQIPGWFKLGYLLPYYFLSLLIGLCMYAVFLFLFGEGNTWLDGILFCGLGIFVLAIVVSTLLDCIGWSAYDRFNPFSWFTVYSPINNLTVVYQWLMHHMRDSNYDARLAEKVMEYSYLFAIWAVLGVAALYGYFHRVMHKRAETAGGVSNSLFGYRMLIPIYGYCYLFSSANEPVLLVLVAVAFVAGYFLYRRSFRLHASDLAVLACGVIPILAGTLV